MDSSQTYICHNCVNEEVLKAHIRKEKKRRKCAYCGKVCNSVKLEWFADTIHEVLQQHYYLTPSEPPEHQYYLYKDSEHGYERPGEPVLYVIIDLAGIKKSIATDIISYLSDIHDFKTKDNMYDDESCYEENSPSDYRYQELWRIFKHEVTSRARFFSKRADEILTELFGDINSLKTFRSEPVVRIVGPQSKDRFIYRARVSQSRQSLKKILGNPVVELGAPESIVARRGRMNPDGISVFYGASKPETCIAEVRPPIGSQVVIGRFELVRDAYLLDFDLLANSYAKGSLFDPEYTEKSEKIAFLRQLVGELVKPVMPGDEKFEYLPTQVIAEYLSEKITPRIDGVIFKSSQTKKGKNIVLLNNSSKTEPYDLPQEAKVSFDFGWASEENEDDTITVSEELPTKNPPEIIVKRDDPFPIMDFDFYDESFNDITDTREVFLRLDIDKIEVKRIKSALYDFDNKNVLRHRYQANEDSDF